MLVRNVASAVSLGTERSIIDLGKKSLIGKARAWPDLFKQAWSKANREGLWKTFQEAMGRLDTPNPLGYSCAGIVEEVGEGADEFSVGDRVVCIGAGFASHAELVSVPKNLCALIREGVAEEEAAFGMLGIIALHGIRIANLHLGTVENYCNKAFRSFYYSPKYVWWRIKKIRDSEEFIRVAKSGFYALKSLPTLGRVIMKKVR